jgi:NIPSNAP
MAPEAWIRSVAAHRWSTMTSFGQAPQRVVELRRYALHPGRRDDLIDLFERELIEPQGDAGMAVLGQFRDLDNPNSFVWLRGFPDMSSRRRSLTDFYRGPVWRQQREAANATMIDSDNVLLLEPAREDSGFTVSAHRPRHDPSATDDSVVLVGIHYFVTRRTSHGRDAFERIGIPLLAETSGTMLGYFVTHPSKNDFPALPVRDEQVLVWLVGLNSLTDLDLAWRDFRYVHRLVGKEVAGSGSTELLRLRPTARSLITGNTGPCRAGTRWSRGGQGTK